MSSVRSTVCVISREAVGIWIKFREKKLHVVVGFMFVAGVIRRDVQTCRIFLIIKPTKVLISQIYFVMKLYMFRTVPLSIISSYSLYIQQWYMSYRFVDSFRAGSGCNCSSILILLLLESCLYDIYHCWVYSEKPPDDGQRNCPKHVEFHFQNKFEKLVHLVGFIIRKFVTTHSHISRCTVTCHDARSHVMMHGHVSRCTVTCHDARSRVTMHGHMPWCTVTCHDARSHECKKYRILWSNMTFC
jgi:hypothetical protein